jgi:SAM-dependent methyltransferase
MEAKPPGWAAGYARWFELPSVAMRYDARPPYPAESLDLLASLVDSEASAVLDAGCGIGDLARPLAERVGRIDAVDQSAAMLARARTMPGGGGSNIRWVNAPIEEASLSPPYGLIACGDSVHWFDWPVVLPLFGRLLTTHGWLAIVQRNWFDPGLRDLLRPVYARHGANPDFAPLDPVTELERRGLFEREGEHKTHASWSPTLAALIACHHSQSGFVLEKMADPDGFDEELASALRSAATEDSAGRFPLSVEATVTWGWPGAR